MICVKCGETNKDNFYSTHKSYCKQCHNEYTIKKRKENKQYALNKFGSKCIICGFDSFPEGLSFHHMDPNLKDVDFNNLLNWSKNRIDKELSTCICLCLTCHAGVHAKRINIGM